VDDTRRRVEYDHRIRYIIRADSRQTEIDPDLEVVGFRLVLVRAGRSTEKR